MLILSCSGNGMMRDFEDILDDSDNGNMDKIQLVLGTYNLRLQTGSDADQRNWENRKQWVRKIVDDYDFDILSTQEGYLGQINDVVENKDYGYVAVGRDDGVNSGETCGILYKKARFGVEAQGTFWLSETPNAPSYGWGAEIRRICTWIKFKEKESGRIFFVFNVHYDHQSVTARDESSKLILNRIKQIAGEDIDGIKCTVGFQNCYCYTCFRTGRYLLWI
jgi:endonuclease/exonuclease/phosphatase family metal-dependent hydrolase